MLVNTEAVKLKNFFKIFDFLADNSPSNRKTIAGGTNLSYSTVSKAVEDLLDVGMISEKMSGKTYYYALSEKYYFIVFDFTENTFAMKLCKMDGTIKNTIFYRTNEMYFYDENLSFFLKDMSVLIKKKCKNLKIIGAATLIPDNSSDFHGTKGILSDSKRLSRLICSYYTLPCVITESISKACSLYQPEASDLVIRMSNGYVNCFRTDSPIIAPAVLKTVNSTLIKLSGKSVSAFARELAYSLGNVCMVLSPRKIYLDSDEDVFLIPSFERTFKDSLCEFTCLPDEMLPEILITNGDLPVLGCAAEIRRMYLKHCIETQSGRYI